MNASLWLEFGGLVVACLALVWDVVSPGRSKQEEKTPERPEARRVRWGMVSTLIAFLLAAFLALFLYQWQYAATQDELERWMVQALSDGQRTADDLHAQRGDASLAEITQALTSAKHLGTVQDTILPLRSPQGGFLSVRVYFVRRESGK
jgi:hypothetical protein